MTASISILAFAVALTARPSHANETRKIDLTLHAVDQTPLPMGGLTREDLERSGQSMRNTGVTLVVVGTIAALLSVAGFINVHSSHVGEYSDSKTIGNLFSIGLAGVSVPFGLIGGSMWSAGQERIDRAQAMRPVVRARVAGADRVIQRKEELDRLQYELGRVELRFGPENVRVGDYCGRIAMLLYELGRSEEARSEAMRSKEVLERSGGSDNPLLSRALLILGKLELDGGSPAQATPLLERARALSQDRGERALSELALAKALVDSHADSVRARELAESADAAMSADPRLAETRRLLEQWMQKQGWRN